MEWPHIVVVVASNKNICLEEHFINLGLCKLVLLVGDTTSILRPNSLKYRNKEVDKLWGMTKHIVHTNIPYFSSSKPKLRNDIMILNWKWKVINSEILTEHKIS
jgi:hypothetical protein